MRLDPLGRLGIGLLFILWTVGVALFLGVIGYLAAPLVLLEVWLFAKWAWDARWPST